MVYRRRKTDSYSYHGDAQPRVVAAIANYPKDDVMYRAGIAYSAQISIPTTAIIVSGLIDQDYLIEGRYALLGPHKRPTPTLSTTEAFFDAVAANPEWQLATDIKRLMVVTGMKEVDLLLNAVRGCEERLAGGDATA